MKILVADDSRSIRGMLRVLLEKAGYEVSLAEDGKVALSKIQDVMPRIAILDWEMPYKSGVEVCTAAREAGLVDLYIIMLTSKGEKAAIVEGLDAGADDYLVKPFSEQELMARIRSGERLIRMHDEKMRYYIGMQQYQRMRSVGVLAAGIAHEINTPAQFMLSNAGFLSEAGSHLGAAFEKLMCMLQAVENGTWTSKDMEGLKQQLEALDVAYWLEELPSAIEDTNTGVETIARTVKALKDFAVPRSEIRSVVNVNEVIQNLLSVSKCRWQDVAEVIMTPDESLPRVPVFHSEFNQALLAILENAILAVAERGDGERKGKIVCECARVGEWVEISISDNGVGMTPEVRDRAIEPFFTTRQEGAGQGQGLTAAYDVVVNKHRGELLLQSSESVGTTVRIRLPVE